jgi:hypothetical protein
MNGLLLLSILSILVSCSNYKEKKSNAGPQELDQIGMKGKFYNGNELETKPNEINNDTVDSGTMKSKNGFLLFYSSDSLNFTIRLDEPNTGTPNWIDNNYLQLFKDCSYIQIIDKESIIKENTPAKDYLSMLQKWETDYIESTMKPSVKRTTFRNDNNSIGLKFNDLKYNAWYYAVELNPGKFYFYFFDIYKSGHFIRITFNGSLDDARLFIPAILKGLLFYNKKLDIKKLQYSLKNHQYSY